MSSHHSALNDRAEGALHESHDAEIRSANGAGRPLFAAPYESLIAFGMSFTYQHAKSKIFNAREFVMYRSPSAPTML